MTTAEKEAPETLHRPTAFLLRVADGRVLEALARYASASRRSQNMALVVILEEALREAGLWPPDEA